MGPRAPEQARPNRRDSSGRGRSGGEGPRHTGRRPRAGRARGLLPPLLPHGRGGSSGGLGGLLKALKLEDLGQRGTCCSCSSSLLLLWEGDDLELVIALGLVLILGLGDGKENDGDAVR